MVLPTPDNYDISATQDIFNKEGKEIFKKLSEKYPENTVKNLDIIMNSLQVAMCILFRLHIAPKDHEKIVKIISQQMLSNLTTMN